MPTSIQVPTEKVVGKIRCKVWKKIFLFCIRKNKSVADVQHAMQYVPNKLLQCNRTKKGFYTLPLIKKSV